MLPIKDDDLLLQSTIDHFMRDKDDCQIELIIRPECNQKCQYCYLIQHGHETYPYRASKEQIIHNMELFINYLIEKDYKIKKIDLFAGDMFYDNLFFDIIKPVKKYFIYLNEAHPEFIDYYKNNPEKNCGYQGLTISIPCNMSFCADDSKIEKVRQICNEFLDINVKIFFSYSTDGIYATNIREHKILSEEYFNKIFAFCEEMNWGLHPMISYESIDNAINNYEWFKKKMRQYRLNNGSSIPCYLEVRNDGWTKKDIQKYQEFLRYHLNDIFHNWFNSNLHPLFNKYFREFELDENGKYVRSKHFDSLGRFNTLTDTGPTCGLGQMSMMVNIGDLNLVPCHRLAYPELRGGVFITNEDNTKIIDLQASEFVNAYFNLVTNNNLLKPKCVSCIYNPFCIKGCHGAQYEKFADPYFSIPSVCELFQAKIKTLIEYYHSIGMFHYIFEVEPMYPVNTLFKNLLLHFGYLEYTKYQKLGDFYG